MPKCQTCGETWNWKESYFYEHGKPCPYCGTKQYADRQSRNMQMMLLLLITLPVLLPAFLDLSLPVTFSALLGAFLLCSAVYPFLLRLSNKEEGTER
ncbi:TIGR04104 family putative zinc finger protein [Salibacterium lacus]|uniref:TIGR04104 family putative zinc finger protein n=1 Tax=Salibacterium lacus TaxID=1898109 RepID=A0ABW5T453_9BACI